MLNEPSNKNELFGKTNELEITYQNELKYFNDSDDTDSSNDNNNNSELEDSDIDSEDEELLLQRELEAIKKEKMEKILKKKEEERKKEEKEKENLVKYGNPLLNLNNNTENDENNIGSFGVKRSWRDDCVFRNQAPEPKRHKRFINDTIRSDFHRKFMERYIK